MNALKKMALEKLPEVAFSMGDLVSMAGKVSIEMAFPCVRPAWRFGRKACNATGITSSGPPGNLDSLDKLQPFLERYSLSDREMAILTIGAHSVKNSEFVPWVFDAENNGPKFINDSVNIEWSINRNIRPDIDGPSYLSFHRPGKIVARLPSDMMFYPSALARIVERTGDNTVTVDDSFTSLEADLTALSAAEFDAEFERVYAKMLEIGTEGLGSLIQNRPKGGQC